jgi:hypothetical protein
MRRPASFPLALMALGLSGCSGLGHFESDTFTLPGANPNKPEGVSENMMRVQSRPVQEAPVEPEPGNVWPGPPQPFPTLSQVERDTQNGQVAIPGGGGGGTGTGGSGGQGVAPSSMGGGKFRMQGNANAASTIVIPNGNGTSTVIAPDGSVKVIPTPAADGGKKP